MCISDNILFFICKTLNVRRSDITYLAEQKIGMTNQSFLVFVHDKKYIIRIPGKGTDQLIDRKQEADVYSKILDKHICDNIIYFNPENGYKIAEYIEDSRTCDSNNLDDLKICMKTLHRFHDLRIHVAHTFDLFEKIEFYEGLFYGGKSVYSDYYKTKENVFSLKTYIDLQKKDYCLTHIDAVPDNFLLIKGGEVRLIDWEYAGMQDPHVDIAMFCIYAMYDKQQVDQLIDIYFDEKCDISTRIKIYCYIAAGGLLWSNWCEYKCSLGEKFGEYSPRQYQYAKEYYNIVMEATNINE